MAPVAEAPRRYCIEFKLVMLLFTATAVGRKFALAGVGDPVNRGLGEYHKRQLLEVRSFSAAVYDLSLPLAFAIAKLFNLTIEEIFEG